jgi:hypothetical protein
MISNTNATLVDVRTRRFLLFVVTSLSIVSILFLLVYHLPEYPTPWYDEGSHLHVAKNFALNGIYADSSSEGYRSFGPVIGVGPTVLLPIAYLFRLSGVGIATARLVIVVYGLLTLLAIYGLALLLLKNEWLALLSIGLLVLSPGVDFITNSRTVLGEVPGLFFISAGLWLWLRAEKPDIQTLVGVGALMGLASITKNQYAMFVLPSLFCCWMADLLYYKRRGWKTFVIPGVIAGLMFVGWLLVVLMISSRNGDLAESFATLRTASAGAFFVLKLQTISEAARFLISSPVYGGLLIPAGLYTIFFCRRKSQEGQRHATVAIFILLGLGMFLASLGWERYAFAPLALSSIFVVRLMVEFFTRFNLNWTDVKASLREQTASPLLLVAFLFVGWVVVGVALPAARQLQLSFTGGNDYAYQVADYLQLKVPQDAVIETWEQELAVLTNHRYHYPPQVELANAVSRQWLGGPPVGDSYDFRTYGNPDYLVNGPFSQYTEIYWAERLTNYQRIETIGPYEIYKRK